MVDFLRAAEGSSIGAMKIYQIMICRINLWLNLQFINHFFTKNRYYSSNDFFTKNSNICQMIF